MPLLDWVNRNQAEETADNVPYHLLKFEKAFGDKQKAKDNLIIHGDNLQALKALLPLYGGQVKCIFIDPPYNTEQAFEHYDDKLEHAQWLSMMYPRLQLLKELLSDDGSIWITVDDHQSHYLKVICDEVFTRRNFVANIVWEKADSPRMDAVYFSTRHDQVLCYAKNLSSLSLGRITSKEIPKHYNRVDDKDERYYTKPLRAMGGQGETRVARPTLYYPIIAPDGSEVFPKLQNGEDGAWRWSKEKVSQEYDEIEWVEGKKGWTPYYKIYAKNIKGNPPETIWFHKDVGTNRGSKLELKLLNLSLKTFDTPKPEKLIKRIIELCTNENDIVLDSFLGSGTTAAVAHKMGRRYIGIEMGDHAKTHVIPRLEKVIDGEQGGISTNAEWQGGGGFSFYTLGSAVFDEQGFLHSEVKFSDLASYAWWLETHTAFISTNDITTPFLGVHEGVAYYLLYNGILGDRRPDGGNVLTNPILKYLNECHQHEGKRIIIGEATRIGSAKLETLDIEFKQIPYALYGSHAK